MVTPPFPLGDRLIQKRLYEKIDGCFKIFIVFYHYHHIISIFSNYTTINSDLKVKDLQSLWFLGFHAEIVTVDSFWGKNLAISSYQEQSR